jgi:cytoskeletal protein CcmA (bactofilin family)/Flp pilus assembly pilin Flp
MKTYMKRLVRDEKGVALVLVLILLLISGLIIGPLLSYMGTGLITGEIYERRTDELYAADAGVEDAIWKIQNQDGYLPCNPTSLPRAFNITDVNRKKVEVTIEYVSAGIYKITSTAVTTDDGSGTVAAVTGTQIEAYVNYIYDDLSGFLDNAITSNDDVTIRPGSVVSGNISLPPDGDLNPPEFVPENGQVNREELIWPTAKVMIDFYWPEVAHLTPVPDGYEINIPSGTTEGNPYVIESLSAAGSLTIKGEGWVKIGGTIYVKGDLDFNANPIININLNQQTIFAEGDIYLPPKVSISGSGCIIAVGDVDYNPNISSGAEDFLLIMSVEGTVKLRPGSNFYGAIVGNVDVTLQPSMSITWVNPEGKGINFPGMDPNDTSKWAWEIETWQVTALSPEDLGG